MIRILLGSHLLDAISVVGVQQPLEAREGLAARGAGVVVAGSVQAAVLGFQACLAAALRRQPQAALRRLAPAQRHAAHVPSALLLRHPVPAPHTHIQTH